MITAKKHLYIANNELKNRQLESEVVKSMATEINTPIALAALERDVFDNNPSVHKSAFLSDDEIKAIYNSQMEIMMENQSGFRFDVWKYAIGGI